MSNDLKNTSMDIQQIKAMLPHRFPFLLVDRVLEIINNQEIIAIKNITINEDVFNGHFPCRPVMPGVLIVEAMAQASCLLIMKKQGLHSPEGKSVSFMSIDEAKFRQPVVPGDTMRMHIKILKNRGAVWKFDGEAFVNEQRVANAIYSAMLVDHNHQEKL